MISKDIALTLKHGQTLYCSQHENVDGTPKRCRVTGKVQTWKRDPARFRVPVKAGMYEYGAIEAWNAPIWHLTEEEAIAARVKV